MQKHGKQQGGSECHISAKSIYTGFEQMYYRSGTGGYCSIGSRQTLCVRSPGGRTVMFSISILTTNQKSDTVNRCVFSWRTIPIQFETTEL